VADAPQENLWDVNSRSKTSAFAWRGQFTPDFVSLVFDKFDTGEGLVLDPFMGSGTVLLEALRRQRPTIGSEINPAAFYLSKVFTLSHLSDVARSSLLTQVLNLISSLKPDEEGNFFSSFVEQAITASDEHLKTLLVALLLLSAKDSPTSSQDSLQKAYLQIENVLTELPFTKTSVQISCSDARSIETEDNSVGFVVTSPPYINVFNYHQNYRPSVEALGWNILEKAQSEIGSNRKNRGNRLLTVIQYTIDMTLLLEELSRVLKEDGVVVMVVGRESNVRGLPFMNSEIIENAIALFPGFTVREKHERKFRSRYGALVYEDILIFSKSVLQPKKASAPEELIMNARAIATSHLERLKPYCPVDVLPDIEQAILKAHSVQPSPLR
tara:strand:+ start:2012 stop:3163 length:1152 start_codon:yes stop_codon:yes gene_type:complete